MSVSLFNSLPNGEYSNLSFVAAFLGKSFSSKRSWSVKNSDLLKFADNKAEILAVSQSINGIELFFAQIYYQFFWFCHWKSCCNKFFTNLNGISDGKIAPFTKKEYGSLVKSL